MKLHNQDVIVCGSSITEDSAWPTWATWINHRYQPANFINIGTKGIGNELILLKAIAQAKVSNNPLIIVQLTNIDKWDWYVPPAIASTFEKEKHPLIKLSPSDKTGFWSTGSHFPLQKEYYKENYFNQDYFAFKTLQLIQWFQEVCRKQHWDYYILFDSPILSVTESYINKGNLVESDCFSTELINNTLAKTLYDLVDFTNIYLPGIIGFAKLNSLPWYTKKIKGHPGSLVHWQFTKDIIAPILDKILTPVIEFDSFKLEATIAQKLFNQL
jgi:hypothetical protein